MDTKEEVARRFFSIRKAKRMKQAEYADAIGVSRSTVAGIENGHAILSDRNIKTVCYIYNVSEEWLRYGKGNMFNPPPSSLEPQTEKEDQLLTMFRLLSDETQIMILEIVKKFVAANEAEGYPQAYGQDDKKEKKIS